MRIKKRKLDIDPKEELLIRIELQLAEERRKVGQLTAEICHLNATIATQSPDKIADRFCQSLKRLILHPELLSEDCDD